MTELFLHTYTSQKMMTYVKSLLLIGYLTNELIYVVSSQVFQMPPAATNKGDKPSLSYTTHPAAKLNSGQLSSWVLTKDGLNFTIFQLLPPHFCLTLTDPTTRARRVVATPPPQLTGYRIKGREGWKWHNSNTSPLVGSQVKMGANGKLPWIRQQSLPLATARRLRTIYTRHEGFPCNADAPVPPLQLINFLEKNN